MPNELGGSSERGKPGSFESDIGRPGGSRHVVQGPVEPAWTPRDDRPEYLGPTPRLVDSASSLRQALASSAEEPSDSPDPAKEPSDSAGPPRRLSASEIGLIGLVGSPEVPSLLIPADSSLPVTKTEFDLDKIWRYEAVGYDKNRVFLTEKHADLDHFTSNALATDWVQNHSDAAKNPDSRLPSPEKLYGPVYVIARDPLMEWITRSTRQLDKLKHALAWIAPFRATD
jgi:hypothetical protein